MRKETARLFGDEKVPTTTDLFWVPLLTPCVKGLAWRGGAVLQGAVLVKEQGESSGKTLLFGKSVCYINTCSDARKPVEINDRKNQVIRIFRCIHPVVWVRLKLQGGCWQFRPTQHRCHNAILEEKSGGSVASVEGCIGGNNLGCPFNFRV